MDAGSEGRVEDGDAVGSQDEDALEVFEHAEEDGDEGVAGNIVVCPLFEEDVCFVEEKEGAPGVGHVEDLGEILLEEAGIDAELADGDGLILVRYKTSERQMRAYV